MARHAKDEISPARHSRKVGQPCPTVWLQRRYNKRDESSENWAHATTKLEIDWVVDQTLWKDFNRWKDNQLKRQKSTRFTCSLLLTGITTDKFSPTSAVTRELRSPHSITWLFHENAAFHVHNASICPSVVSDLASSIMEVHTVYSYANKTICCRNIAMNVGTSRKNITRRLQWQVYG